MDTTEVTREMVKATDAEIAEAFGEDAETYYLIEDDLAFGLAAEVVDLGKRQGWSDPGRLVRATADEFLAYGVQFAKGQQRRTVHAVRFGEHCAILGYDK